MRPQLLAKLHLDADDPAGATVSFSLFTIVTVSFMGWTWDQVALWCQYYNTCGVVPTGDLGEDRLSFDCDVDPISFPFSLVWVYIYWIGNNGDAGGYRNTPTAALIHKLYLHLDK